DFSRWVFEEHKTDGQTGEARVVYLTPAMQDLTRRLRGLLLRVVLLLPGPAALLPGGPPGPGGAAAGVRADRGRPDRHRQCLHPVRGLHRVEAALRLPARGRRAGVTRPRAEPDARGAAAAGAELGRVRPHGPPHGQVPAPRLVRGHRPRAPTSPPPL